jgi:hypothetical protein
MRAFRSLAWLGLLLAGCAIYVDGHHPDAVDAAIDEAAAEVNRHYAALFAAPTAADARAEIERHGAAMHDRLVTVERRVVASDCGGGMVGMMDEAGDRLATYLDEVQAAPTLGAARETCAAYGDDMDLLLGRLERRWRDASCP